MALGIAARGMATLVADAHIQTLGVAIPGIDLALRAAGTHTVAHAAHTAGSACLHARGHLATARSRTPPAVGSVLVSSYLVDFPPRYTPSIKDFVPQRLRIYAMAVCFVPR